MREMPLRVFSPHIPAYYKGLKSLSRLPQFVFILLHWPCPDFITDYFKAGEILD